MPPGGGIQRWSFDSNLPFLFPPTFTKTEQNKLKTFLHRRVGFYFKSEQASEFGTHWTGVQMRSAFPDSDRHLVESKSKEKT